MEESSLDKNEQFVKQRRNVLAVCVALCLYHLGEFELKKINILGNEAYIRNPENAAIFLYIIFTYFIWRFHSACLESLGISNFRYRLKELVIQKAQISKHREILKKTGLKESDNAFSLERDGSDTFFYKITIHSPHISKQQRAMLNDSKILEIKSYKKIIIKILCFISFSLNRQAFGEFVFPYIFIIITTGISFYYSCLKSLF